MAIRSFEPSRIHIWGWGLGSVGLATIHNTLNVLLMAYLTLVVGFDPATAGSVVLLTKLYDVVTDLPTGWLSDRTKSPMGRRRPYLLAATAFTPAALFLLFTAGPQGQTQAIAGLLLYATGYTLFNVPYLSMPSEMTSKPDVRTNMIGVRSFAIAIGTFFGVAFAPYFIGISGGGHDAYSMLAIVMASIIFAAFLGCFLSLKGVPDHSKGQVQQPVFGQLAAIIRGRAYQMLLSIKILHLLGLAVGAGSLFFFVRYALGYDTKTLGLYGLVTTVAWAISMPFWTRLANNKGKRFGYFIATILYTLMTLSWLFATSGEPIELIVLRAILFGFLSGGMLLMGNGMLQDVMDDDFRRSGQHRNGLIAASYSLTEKITSGVGAQILGLVLSTTGFNRAVQVQSESAIDGIYITVALIPAICMALSLFAIKAYNLSEENLKSEINR